MTVTDKVCSECGETNSSSPNYCPNCGSENPWETEARYEFDEGDLPVIFETSMTDDFWELWYDFTQSYFGYRLDEEDVADLPDNFPRMKYRYIDVYWVLTEELEIEGPFCNRSEAREDL
jgi:hypothetical protein